MTIYLFDGTKLISVSWLSESKELNAPLFRYVCKVNDMPRRYWKYMTEKN